MVVPAPETGSIGGSMNKSVVFNKPADAKKKEEEKGDGQAGTKGPELSTSTVQAAA
jgi:hypothetical protein